MQISFDLIYFTTKRHICNSCNLLVYTLLAFNNTEKFFYFIIVNFLKENPSYYGNRTIYELSNILYKKFYKILYNKKQITPSRGARANLYRKDIYIPFFYSTTYTFQLINYLREVCIYLNPHLLETKFSYNPPTEKFLCSKIQKLSTKPKSKQIQNLFFSLNHNIKIIYYISSLLSRKSPVHRW